MTAITVNSGESNLLEWPRFCWLHAGLITLNNMAAPNIGSKPASRHTDLVPIALAAFVVRVAWVFWGSWEARDSRWYLRAARNLVFHHVFSASETTGPFSPTAHRPPLYPVLIAAVWFSESAPVMTVLLLQTALGAATVVLVYLIARDQFNRQVAVLAAAGMALAPMTGRFTAVILTETLFTFLLTLGAFHWGRKRYRWTGAAFGLASLTRMTMLPFLVVLPVLTLFKSWRGERRAFVTITLVAFVVVAPWTLRNAFLFHRFIPLAASGIGNNLLWGTLPSELFGNKVWTGTEWSTSPQNLAITQVDQNLSEAEQNRERFNRAIQRIVGDPLSWIRVRAAQYPKLFVETGSYLFASGDVPIKTAIGSGNFLVVVMRLIFVVGNIAVFIFAALGLITRRRALVSLSPLAMFPIYLCLVHLPFWIEPRYALPMMPMIAILAAAGALQVEKFVKAKCSRSAK